MSWSFFKAKKINHAEIEVTKKMQEIRECLSKVQEACNGLKGLETTNWTSEQIDALFQSATNLRNKILHSSQLLSTKISDVYKNFFHSQSSNELLEYLDKLLPELERWQEVGYQDRLASSISQSCGQVEEKVIEFIALFPTSV